MIQEKNKVQLLNTALYIRLSREDGDKAESFSVTNQRLLLQDFISKYDDLIIYDYYVDDGYSGTNFDRPDFNRMLLDIENGKINCVVVKDLSRLGRNNVKTSIFVNEYFPSHRVRFIAVNDGIDKKYYDFDTSTDMMLDVKNMFNGFYPRDISQKVRSTFRTKQKNGQFIGAFPSYGYIKSEIDHNHLCIDEEASKIVQRIYSLYISGIGQNTIAKLLNEEGTPCPSAYKKLNGSNYRNTRRLESTNYWTYSTVHNILKNEIYAGNMVQNKSFRMMCKKHAIKLPEDKWIKVEGTHEAIINYKDWMKVQELLQRNTKQTNLNQNIHKFAGFVQCGDCGRAMVKIRRKGVTFFNCGSYNRYGKTICSMHAITEEQLEKIILSDLNRIIESIENLQQLVDEEKQKAFDSEKLIQDSIEKISIEKEKKELKKDRLYDDLTEGILTKEEYMKYKRKLDDEIKKLNERINQISEDNAKQDVQQSEWIDRLLNYGKIDHLDRNIVVEMISMIKIYENNTIEIIYNFSNEMNDILPKELRLS